MIFGKIVTVNVDVMSWRSCHSHRLLVLVLDSDIFKNKHFLLARYMNRWSSSISCSWKLCSSLDSATSRSNNWASTLGGSYSNSRLIRLGVKYFDCHNLCSKIFRGVASLIWHFLMIAFLWQCISFRKRLIFIEYSLMICFTCFRRFKITASEEARSIFDQSTKSDEKDGTGTVADFSQKQLQQLHQYTLQSQSLNGRTQLKNVTYYCENGIMHAISGHELALASLA